MIYALVYITWKQIKTSQVTYVNHGSPSGERDTASPRGRYGERRLRNPCLKYTYIKTPLVGRRQPMTSLPVRPQYKGRRENTSFASSSEACVRSMAHSLGDVVSRSPLGEPLVTYVTWDVPFHGNFELRPLGVAMGNVIPTPPCWGECKPNSCRRRALANSTRLRDLPLGRLMAVSDIIPFGQKPSCIP